MFTCNAAHFPFYYFPKFHFQLNVHFIWSFQYEESMYNIEKVCNLTGSSMSGKVWRCARNVRSILGLSMYMTITSAIFPIWGHFDL